MLWIERNSPKAADGFHLSTAKIAFMGELAGTIKLIIETLAESEN